MECFGKQVTDVIIFASSNYFRNISFSYPVVHAIFNVRLIFAPEFFIQCKKVFGPGTVNFYIPPRSFTVILVITFEFQRFLT